MSGMQEEKDGKENQKTCEKMEMKGKNKERQNLKKAALKTKRQ